MEKRQTYNVDFTASSEGGTLELFTDVKTIVEMAILPEVPTVQYSQQLYIHVPTASYTTPGIASFSNKHFRIIGNQILLSDDILNQAHIIYVSELPTDDIDSNSIYVVDDKFYIYLETKKSWIRLLSQIDRDELEEAISNLDGGGGGGGCGCTRISNEDIDKLFGG